MSKGRRAVNFAGKPVAQQPKLPPRKRPNGRAMNKLLMAIIDVLESHEYADAKNPAFRDYCPFELQMAMLRLAEAAAPFRRYADGEGKDIR